MSTQDNVTIDVTPTPRVLRMLGQVDLSPARCFAEFIDNALDEGIDGTPGRGQKSDAGETLRIEIETPTWHEYDNDYENAKVIVRDNGPGMSKEDLEKNLKAGYSGKDPLNEMGLFGMGFNIATARLGNRTSVRTTQVGDDHWSVATIDFRDLETKGTFKVDVDFEDKEDPSNHGTEIIIGRLNEMARTLNQKQNMPENLGDWYTPVLERENVKITINGDEISPKPACTWSEERSVEIGNEEFPAYLPLDEKIGEGHYCKECWTWWDEQFLTQNENETWECPSCEDGGEVVEREQRVWGWVGIQRFFDQNHYGIDLVRNGRIIEKHDKSLFYWENPDGEMVMEYPIDTEHWGGRIVGELHIDFVPVTNTKDAFDKSNERWRKVRETVRGEAPFRPQIARDHGYEPNRSPLGKLYKGYRTGNEVGKKRLVPGEVKGNGDVEGDNTRPREWAELFWEGKEEYQDDSKWWELVEQAEEAMRDSSSGEEDDEGDESATSQSDSDSTDGSDTTGSDTTGFDLDPSGGDNTDSSSGDESGTDLPTETESETETNQPVRETVHEEDLSGTYGLDEIGQPEISFEVYRLEQGNMDNGPVEVERDSWQERTVTYEPNHEFFTEFGHNPIDSILMEAAYTFRKRMDDPSEWRQTRLFAELQAKYCEDDRVSPEGLAARANEQLASIKERVADEEFDLKEYEINDDVVENVRESVLEMRGRGGGEVDQLLESSAYLEFASHEELVEYFRENPEQFFDETVWMRDYENLGSDRLKEQSVSKFAAYLRDVVMLADQATRYDLVDARPAKRIEIDRAAESLRLLGAEAADSTNV